MSVRACRCVRILDTNLISNRYSNPKFWNAFAAIGTDVIINLGAIRGAELHRNASEVEADKLMAALLIQSGMLLIQHLASLYKYVGSRLHVDLLQSWRYFWHRALSAPALQPDMKMAFNCFLCFGFSKTVSGFSCGKLTHLGVCSLCCHAFIFRIGLIII